MIRATGRCELSCENSFELLGTYISLFRMSTETKKGVADGSASSKGNQEALNRDSSTAAGTLIGAK